MYVIRIRRGTVTEWADENPILMAGEVGYETDSRRYKVGDGTTPWITLGYAAEGPPGPIGPGVSIKGFLPNQAALPASANPTDVYILQDTLHGWMWDGSRWVDVGPIQGPKGEPGPPGPLGPEGPPGERGGWAPVETYRDILAKDPLESLSFTLGDLSNVVIPDDVPINRVLGTTAIGQWGPIDIDHRYVTADGGTMTGSLEIISSYFPQAVFKGYKRDGLCVYINLEGNESSLLRLDKTGTPIWVGITVSDTDLTLKGNVYAPTPKNSGQVLSLTRNSNSEIGDFGLPGNLGSDTGARDVSSMLVNGWSVNDHLRLSRQGNVVTLIGKLTALGATSSTFLTMPVGFRPVSSVIWPVANGASADSLSFGVLDTGQSDIWRYTTSMHDVTIHHSWNTTDNWPAVLPGTQITPPVTWT
jgi:hypothetical protein